MKIILATDPAHDLVTQHLSRYVQDIISHVEAIDDAEISILQGKDVNPDNLKRLIQEKNPALVLFNGHGQHDTIHGFNDVVLISTTSDALELFESRIIHALSCWCGQELGQKMVDLGAKTFVGYTQPFEFYGLQDEPLRETDPDPIASLFLEPANEVVKMLCSGQTAREAQKQAHRMYAQVIQDVYQSAHTDIAKNRNILLASLRKNRGSLIVLGDLEGNIEGIA